MVGVVWCRPPLTPCWGEACRPPAANSHVHPLAAAEASGGKLPNPPYTQDNAKDSGSPAAAAAAARKRCACRAQQGGAPAKAAWRKTQQRHQKQQQQRRCGTLSGIFCVHGTPWYAPKPCLSRLPASPIFQPCALHPLLAAAQTSRRLRKRSARSPLHQHTGPSPKETKAYGKPGPTQLALLGAGQVASGVGVAWD